MNKKVYIHIGLPKTATSSIQAFLFSNNDWLHEQGYHYLQSGLSPTLKCHHEMIWKLGLHPGLSYVEKDVTRHRARLLKELDEEVRSEPYNTIISSELLTFVRDFNQLKPLLEMFERKEIFYILYLRRQDYFLESLYQQIIKDGATLPFDEWFKNSKNIGNFNHLINRLSKISPLENVLIDSYDPEQEGFNPVKNFLSMIGINEAAINEKKIANIRTNESLSKEQVERLRLSNLQDVHRRFKLLKEFENDNRNTKVKKIKIFDNDQRVSILNMYRQSNRRLIERMSLPPRISKQLPH